MNRHIRFASGVLAALVILGGLHVIAAPAPQRTGVAVPDLSGKWTLNTARSQFPTDLGFGMDLIPPAAAAGRENAETAARPFMPRNDSEYEIRNAQQLTGEVRSPSPHLTIQQAEGLVTITDEQGQVRRLQTDGRTTYQPLEAQPVQTTAKWENGQLVVRYRVQQDRELRYAISRKTDPPQLVVQVQFVERNGRGTITRVYDPWRADEPPVVIPTAAAAGTLRLPSAAQMTEPPPSPLRDALKGADQPKGAPPLPPADPGKMMPAVPGASDVPMGGMKPDAELRGLLSMGIVVEGADSAPASCGLSSEGIETALAKRLTDEGIKVPHNADEDTYLYVNVKTATMGTGVCVSRFDATIYTHTMATLTYQASPVLVEVSLLRQGGIVGGPAAQHGTNVLASLRQYVDGFIARIKAASK